MISPIKGQFVRSSSTGRNTSTALMAGNALCWPQTNSVATVSVSTKPNTNIAHRYRHRIHRTRGPNLCRKFNTTHNAPRHWITKVQNFNLMFWSSGCSIFSASFSTLSLRFCNHVLFKQSLLFYNLRARLGEDLVSNVGPGIKALWCGFQWIW